MNYGYTCPNCGYAVRRLWDGRTLKLLRERFPFEPTADIAHDFHRSAASVSCQASKMGLRKDKAYISNARTTDWRVWRKVNGKTSAQSSYPD
jgi:hypothetical protein